LAENNIVNADIFIEIGPMDAFAGADQFTVVPFRGFAM
jgi:hypothetical protein